MGRGGPFSRDPRCCDQVVLLPDLASHANFHDNVARVMNRLALDQRIGAVFGNLNRDQIVGRLIEAKIAHGAVNDLADFAAHPQLKKTEVKTPEGTVVMIAPPTRIDGTDMALGPVPALDADGAAIRAEFTA